jgi:RNA polymerase sigma-70 factor (ECF subfamily)
MVTACPIEWEPLHSPGLASWFVIPVVPVTFPDGAGAGRHFMDHGTTATTDESLMGEIALGDVDSFTEFYDRHSGLLFSVAVHILRDEREAEDVLQEAMVALWERAARYDASLGKPVSWVVTMTRNRAIDRLRGLKRRPQATAVELEEPDAVSDEADSATARMMSHESALSLRKALGQLPEDQRRAIELAFFGGLTHVEIAESTATPLGTVKARIRRGMLQLRDGLDGLL